MASNEEFCVDGTPITDLRVVDLKEQLEKRGLSKSGSKTVLLKRLKDQLVLEKLQAEQLGKDPSTAPNMEMKTCGNDFVAEYLEKQQQLLQAARMAGGRPAASSESPTASTTASTPATPDVDNRIASPTSGKRSRSSRTKSPRQSTADLEVSVSEPAVAATPSAPSDIDEPPPTVVPPTAEESQTAEEVSTQPELETSGEPIIAPETVKQQVEPSETLDAADATKDSQSVAESEQQQAAVETPPQLVSGIEEPSEMETVFTESNDGAGGEESAPVDATAPVMPTDEEAKNVEDVGEGDSPSAPAAPNDDDNGEKKPEDAVDTDSNSMDDAVMAIDDSSTKQGNDDQDRIDGEESVVVSAFPVDEPDDVEMEMSAPINAADEILEAVNAAPATSTGGKKVASDHEDSLPGVTAQQESENRDIPQRKRKWVAATRSKRTPVSISSDSLKEIVGSVSEGMKEEEIKMSVEEEEIPVPPKRIVITRDVSNDENADLSSDAPRERRVEVDESRPRVNYTEDGFLRVSAPSPARHPPSNIIHIRGLTRPFTVQALYDLLSKFGNFIKEEFWIDAIKSHCIVKYSNEEEATLARERLHNIQWPSSNAKMLRVDFASQEDLDRNREREGPAARGPQPDASREDASEKAPEEQREGRRVVREDRGRRSVSPRRTRDRDRSWDRGKTWRMGESPPTDPRGAGARKRVSLSPERRAGGHKGDQPVKPAKLLDDLFRKTKATPCIYWLPLSEEQIREKERERKKREQERYERIRKLEDEDRNRPREPYRRHSPFDYRSRRR